MTKVSVRNFRIARYWLRSGRNYGKICPGCGQPFKDHDKASSEGCYTEGRYVWTTWHEECHKKKQEVIV